MFAPFSYNREPDEPFTISIVRYVIASVLNLRLRVRNEQSGDNTDLVPVRFGRAYLGIPREVGACRLERGSV